MKKILWIVFAVTANLVWAVNPQPFTVGVGFSPKVDGSSRCVMTVGGEPGDWVYTDTAESEGDMKIAWLRPGQAYSVNAGFEVYAPSNYWLSFVPPDGYAIYINGAPMDLVHVSEGTNGSYSDDYWIEVRPVGESSLAEPGSFSGIEIGQSITWQVGLGAFRTGASAGRINFKEFDLVTNAPANRARLFYSEPSNYGQIQLVRDPGQTLRQIMTPRGLVDIVDLTGTPDAGYAIKFYAPSQATWTGSIYTLSGSPWHTITVESPGTNQLTITETEVGGSVSRVSQLSQSTLSVASGGTVTTSGAYKVHTFASSGTFTPSAALSVDYLVLAGGGGGGSALTATMDGGGGGGGGLRTGTGFSVSATGYSITVGAGGSAGTNGGDSTFSTITSTGGGHGAHAAYNAAAGNGGSGGGQGTPQGNGPGTGTSGQGYGGGYGTSGGDWNGGGGGGAGGAGSGINGGSAASSSISGSTAYYGGGGGGGSNGAGGGTPGTNAGAGGIGSGSNATANFGGGGGAGGGSNSASVGGSGGSGVVIIRYPATFVWTLQEGDGNSSHWERTTTHTGTQSIGGQRDDVVEVRTGGTSGTVVAKTKYHYENKAWGEELIQIIADPAGAALTTAYTYAEDAPVSGYETYRGNYRKISSITYPTGDWVSYHRNDAWNERGQKQYEFHPYVDSPSTSPWDGRVTYTQYVADWTGRHRLASDIAGETDSVTSGHTVVTPTLNQTTLGQYYTIYQSDAYADVSNYERTITEMMDTRGDNNPDYNGLIWSVKRPDQSQDSYAHYQGSYSSGTFTYGGSGPMHFRTIVWHGSSSSSVGDSFTGYDGIPITPLYLIANKSTMDVTVRSPAGLVLRTETHVYTGSGSFSLMTYEDFTYDGAGRLTQRVAHTGATTDYHYNSDGQMDYTKDPAGIRTDFTYDYIGRLKTSVKQGASSMTAVFTSGYTYPSQGDITTEYTYDGANHVKQTEVSATGADTQTTTSNYDLSGRLTQQVANAAASDSTKHFVTDYVYTSDGKVVTATLPGPSGARPTKVTETCLDGQLRQVYGSGAVSEYYSYWVDGSTGMQARQSTFGGFTDAWTNVYNDWLDRKAEEWSPRWDGYAWGRLWYYNSAGQLCKFTQPKVADTLYTYDTMGVLFREGLDIGADGTLDVASDDRITEHSWTYATACSYGDTGWFLCKNKSVYPRSGNGTPKVVEKLESQVAGMPTNRIERTDHVDVFGNTTLRTYTELDRTNKKVTTTRWTMDANWGQQIAHNGLAVEDRDYAAIVMRLEYDALGRQVKSINPRTAGSGTGSPFGTVTAFVSGTSLVSSVTDPAGVAQATYAYDETGQVKLVAIPNPHYGTGGDTRTQLYTRYDYNDRGQKTHEWGDAIYPVEYVYDDLGRQIEMKTYRAASGLSSTAWASITPGTADSTTWAFDAATGLLSSKSDAATNSVDYTYTVDGKIKTRNWARGELTTYYYFGEGSGEPVTGELRKVDYYNSGFTDLEYTYNRLGQTATVLDFTGTRTFNYALTGTLELQNEVVGTSSSDFYGDRLISRGYDTAVHAIGRYYEIAVGDSSDMYADYAISFGYDSAGRPNSAWDFNYTYATNSNLIDSVAHTAWDYSDVRTYDPAHDWTKSRTTKIGSAVRSAFGYTFDSLGRIEKVEKRSDANGLFTRYGNATQGLDTYYGYDDRSQLTSEQTKLGGSGTPLTGREDSYTFDTIGNRSTVIHNTDTSDYNPSGYPTNNLNQYVKRTVPSYFDVAGAAAAAATVTVNSAAVTRHGDYFFKKQALSNNPNPVFASLSVYDGTTTTAVPAFLAGTPESFSYDLDGNLTSDGRWDYTYDGENRLLSAQTHTALSPTPLANADARRLEFKYDYLGRRVEKIVRDGYNGTSYTSVNSDIRCLYDGWNLLYEYDALNSLHKVRVHVWGLDVSGTLDGAGGVGGLLATYDYLGNNWYMPMYDALGNVHGMIKTSDGSIAAAYEYDAFGQTLRESGAYAATNPFRYSTKVTDNETSLVYYGHRYYSPWLGRFICRDPKDEDGGRNLYAFLHNNSINNIDLLGWHSVPDAEFWEVFNGGGGGGGGGLGGSNLLAVTQVMAANNGEAVYMPSASHGDIYTVSVGSFRTKDGLTVYLPGGTTLQDFDSGGIFGYGVSVNTSASSGKAYATPAPADFQGTPGTNGTPTPGALELPKFTVSEESSGPNKSVADGPDSSGMLPSVIKNPPSSTQTSPSVQSEPSAPVNPDPNETFGNDKPLVLPPISVTDRPNPTARWILEMLRFYHGHSRWQDYIDFSKDPNQPQNYRRWPLSPDMLKIPYSTPEELEKIKTRLHPPGMYSPPPRKFVPPSRRTRF